MRVDPTQVVKAIQSSRLIQFLIIIVFSAILIRVLICSLFGVSVRSINPFLLKISRLAINTEKISVKIRAIRFNFSIFSKTKFSIILEDVDIKVKSHNSGHEEQDLENQIKELKHQDPKDLDPDNPFHIFPQNWFLKKALQMYLLYFRFVGFKFINLSIDIESLGMVLSNENVITEVSLKHRHPRSKFSATLRFFHQAINDIEIFDAFTMEVGGQLNFNNGEISRLNLGVELRNLSLPVLSLIKTLPKDFHRKKSTNPPIHDHDFYLARLNEKLFFYCFFIKLIEKIDIAFHNVSVNEIPLADAEQIQASNYDPLVKFELKVNALAFNIQRMYFDSPGYGLSYTYEDKPFHVIYNFTEISLAMCSVNQEDYKPILTIPVMNFTGSSNLLFQTLEASKHHAYTDGKILLTGHLSDLIFDTSIEDIKTVVLSALDFMKCKKKSQLDSEQEVEKNKSDCASMTSFPKLWPKVELKLSIENPIFLVKSPLLQQFYKILVLKFSLISVEFKTTRTLEDDQMFYSTSQVVNLANTKLKYIDTHDELDETALFWDDIDLKQTVDLVPQLQVSTFLISQSSILDLSNLKVLHGINSLIGELYQMTKPLFDQYKHDLVACGCIEKEQQKVQTLDTSSSDGEICDENTVTNDSLADLIPQWISQIVYVSNNTSIILGSRSLLIPKDLVKNIDPLSKNDLINGDLRKIAVTIEKWSISLLSQAGKIELENTTSSNSSLEDDDKGLLDSFSDEVSVKEGWKLKFESTKLLGKVVSESSKKHALADKVFLKIPICSILVGPMVEDVEQLSIDFNLEKIDIFYSVMTHFIIISSLHLLRNTIFEFLQYSEKSDVPKTPSSPEKKAGIEELLDRVHLNFNIDYLDLIFVAPDRMKLKCEVNRASAIVLPKSPILLNSHYMRLCAESPTTPGYWSRILTAVNGSTQVNIQDILANNDENTWFNLANESCHLTIPHQFIIYKVFENISVMAKTLRQLHHSLKYNTDEIVINPKAKPAHKIPRTNLKSNRLLFSMDDDPFEAELNMIFQIGLVEQKMRLEKTKMFDARISEELQNQRQKAPKSATFPTSNIGHDVNSDLPNISNKRKFLKGKPARFSSLHHSSSMDALFSDRREKNSSNNSSAKLAPDFNKIFDVRQNALEKLHKMREGFSKSWIARIRAYKKNQEREFQQNFKYLWGNLNMDHLPQDFNKKVLDFVTSPSLFILALEDVDLNIAKPSFGIEGIPDFIYDVGKGKPKDSQYSTLIPLFLDLKLGELRCHLRDYPLPFIYMPRMTKAQDKNLSAVRIHGDVVIGENTIKSHKEVREVYVPLVPGCREFDEDNLYSIEVPKTLTSIKFYTKLDWDLNSADTTKVTWGTSYQPCIQQIMLNLDNFTKPPIDPSEKVGFWDKLRANFHARFSFHWKQNGGFDVIFKGSKNPYDICGIASGFLLGFKDGATLSVNEKDDPREFLVANSNIVMFAVPNHLAEPLLVWCRETEKSIFLANQSTNFQGSTYGYYFNVDEIPDAAQVDIMAEHYLEKVAIKLSGGVQFNLAFFFERKTDDGNERTSDFISHDEVLLCNPKYVEDRDNYDAYYQFRSHYIHMGLTLVSKSEDAYNTIQLTPAMFEHFFKWWHMFSNTFPVRHGKLFGPEKATKKFARHLYTIKYQAIADPLFITHVYHDHDLKRQDHDKLSSVGIKSRASNFVLDLHQRKELTYEHNPKLDVTKKIMRMGFNIGQVSMTDLDMRTMNGLFELDKDLNMARKRATGEKTSHNHHVEVFDGDKSWFDIRDFTEIGTSTLDGYKSSVQIHPLMFTPSFMYFKRNDHGDKFQINIDTGERIRPFGKEKFHNCLFSGHDSNKVQQDSFTTRIDELTSKRKEKLAQVEQMETTFPQTPTAHRDISQLQLEIRKLNHAIQFVRDLAMANEARSPTEVIENSSFDFNINDDFEQSPFRNKFIIHNMLLKWNDKNRDVVYKYVYLFEMTSQFSKFMQHKSLGQIEDIIEAQARRAEHSRFSRQATHVTQATYESKGLAETETHPYDKSVNETRASEKLKNFEDELYEIPIDFSYITQENYLLKLISPQIQLQSENSKDSAVMIVAPNIELKVLAFDVNDTDNEYNENIVEQRFGAVLTDASAFVFYDDDIQSRHNVIFSNSNYGSTTSWPPWVGIELCYDGAVLKNHMLMEKTSVVLRYDKPDESYFVNDKENSINKMSCDLSQAVFKCDARQYYSLYTMIMSLLIYNEPRNVKLKEKESKMLLRLDVNDISSLKDRILKLQESIRQMKKIENNLTGRRSILDDVERNDLLVVSTKKEEAMEEVYLLMHVALLGGRQAKASDDYLEWDIRADDIKLHMLDDERLPFLDVLLTNSHFKRVEGSDRSNRNIVVIETVEVLNLEKDTQLPVLFAPYENHKRRKDSNKKSKGHYNVKQQPPPIIHVIWKMDNPVGGIRVIRKFEVGLEPLQLNVDQFTGEKIMKYAFPDSSPLLAKSPFEDDGEIDDDGDDELDKSEPVTDNANFVANGNGNHSVEINPHDTNGQTINDDQSSASPSQPFNKKTQSVKSSINGNQPSAKKSIFSFKSKDGSVNGNGSASHIIHGLDEEDDDQDDDEEIEEMIRRASNYLSIVSFKFKSCVISVTFRGHGSKRLVNVTDFALTLPEMTFTNQTWTLLDLTMEIKKFAIKALLSHTGSILGNKMVNHGRKRFDRPNRDNIRRSTSRISSFRSSN